MMYSSLVDVSTTTPWGSFNVALKAEPPSPVDPALPVPATGREWWAGQRGYVTWALTCNQLDAVRINVNAEGEKKHRQGRSVHREP